MSIEDKENTLKPIVEKVEESTEVKKETNNESETKRKVSSRKGINKKATSKSSRVRSKTKTVPKASVNKKKTEAVQSAKENPILSPEQENFIEPVVYALQKQNSEISMMEISPQAQQLSDPLPVDVFYKTGILPFDLLGNGGIYQGKLYEICGEPGGGKTTLSVQIARNLLNRYKDYRVLYVDIERCMTESFMKSMRLYEFYVQGRFLYKKMSRYEDIDNMLTDYLMKNNYGITMVILDTVSSLISAELVEYEVDKTVVAEDARIQTRFVKKYKAVFDDAKCTGVVISQMRNKLDNMGNWRQKSSTVREAAGGYAIKHGFDCEFQIDKGSLLHETSSTKNAESSKKKEKVFGQLSVLKAKKSRCAIAHTPIQMCMAFGYGFSNLLFLRHYLTEFKMLVSQGFGRYILYYGEEQIHLKSSAEVNSWLANYGMEIFNFMVDQDYFLTSRNEYYV